ncbi:MAG TPA: helix-turn-helix domain-containing protein [Solirubrobacterales bacterium]|nr:helix-turn-helix domain-containing protein [Solirubrobacterales bacterium]
MGGKKNNAGRGGGSSGDDENVPGDRENTAEDGDAVESDDMTGDGDELLIALRHPLRRQILRVMIRQEPTSPRQIADELNEPLSNVSYHVRVLAELGVAILVDTTPVRGSMQHFYSPTIDEPWALEVLGISENGESAPGGEDEEPEP